MRFLPALALAMILPGSAVGAAGEQALRWLEGCPEAGMEGATLGVPWPMGQVPGDAAFSLRKSSGETVPAQNWRLAVWPDGSLKWSAHALGADARPADGYVVSVGPPAAPAAAVTVVEEDESVTVDNGVFSCRLSKRGEGIVASIRRDGRETVRGGRLVLLNRDKAEMDGTWREERFTGDIEAVTVEQRGPVRAVVKVEGRHVNDAGRRWLPFVLRFYFHAGADSVRILHTIIYDGDQHKDFIGGLGLRFAVPLEGAAYDRHVRFAGADGGVFGEAVQGITGLRRDPGAQVRAAQIDGRSAPPLDTWDKRVSGALAHVPVFGDYSLVQATSDAFRIRKRTREGFVWLDAGHGRRSAGLGFVGTPGGGAAFGIRNFWQSHPARLDIRNAASDAAEVTLWLWSPSAEPMDMRFYHDGMGQDTYAEQLKGLEITYEDYEPGFATPHGVARTSELRLWALPATPPRERIAGLAATLATPPQLVCAPEGYRRAQVFGDSWGLPDRSTPFKAAVEDQLDFYFDHYKKEVEQRRWYGFWHYGDVMHSYDRDRHAWKYDIGGYAWDNSELSTDLWLWYAFLRSGRADMFRLAEAMTRHTGEVDVYHLGRFKGLGTRHGVVHWGDSAKQLRISTAANRRFLYYLSADERIGDLLWEQVDIDRTVSALDPGRKLPKPPTPAGAPKAEAKTERSKPMRMNTGTDWYSVAAAVLTAWERTGEAKYRDKLRTAMESIGNMPLGLFHGGGEYDPETGEFRAFSDKVSMGSLAVVFGGVEMNAEMLQLLDVPGYAKTWREYCEVYNLPRAERERRLGQKLGNLNLQQPAARMTAYAAWKGGDRALAERAWKEFLSGTNGPRLMRKPYPVVPLSGPEVLNPIDEVALSTNGTAQWGLAAIQCLHWIGAFAPHEIP